VRHGTWLQAWRAVSWMFAGSLAGMPFGLAVLLFAPEDALRFGVGVTTIVMAAALASGLRLGDSSLGRELGVGVVSGVLNTSTSMNGPPVVLYLQGLGYPTQTFRGGLGAFFTAVGVLTFFAFLATGVVTWLAVGLAASAVPSVFVGSLAGHALLRRVEAAPFRRLVFAMLIAAALSAVGSSLARMLG
ncbi:MAG: sulfite exporter TauE/SafE family protein, partial [Dehalococcoidia bacterium]